MALNITKEEILKKLNSSPAQKFLESTEITQKVSEISEKYYFDIDPAENLVFHQLVALVAIEILDKASLINEIVERIETDEQNAAAAADEVFQLLSNIPKEPTTTIKPVVMDGLPPKQPTTTPASTQSTQPQTSTFGPGRPVSEPSAPTNHYPLKPNHSSTAPFVIHENEEVKSNVNINAEARGTTRPVFYKPATPQKPADYSPPSTVRVDIGGETVNPQATPKTVNYTAYTPQQATKTNQNQTTKVHPENIVDLKDLPR